MEEFAEWAYHLKYEDIPPSVIRKTKLQILNMLSAGFAGMKWGNLSFSPNSQEGTCTLLNGKKADFLLAIFFNSTWSMVHDYDDYLFMGHTGHSSLYSSLALLEGENGAGKELLRAMVICNELEGRLGASVLIGPHNGQMWGFIHQAGSAVLTALLRGGGKENISRALLFSLYLPPYPLEGGFMGGDSKYLTASQPSCAGVLSGLLALEKTNSTHNILFGDEGFYRKFSYIPLTEMLSGWGKVWLTETISFKPYPGCAYIQTALECLMEILSKEKFEIEDVDEINVRASLPTVLMEKMSERHRGDNSLPVNVHFSVPLSVAVTLLNGNPWGNAMSRDFLIKNREKIMEISKKIKVSHCWKHTEKLIMGIKNGIDLFSVLRGKGIIKTISGLKKFSKGREWLKMLRGIGEFSLKEIITGGKRWRKFDLEKAEPEKIAFLFPASVEIKLKSGKRFFSESLSHKGSAGRELKETEDAVVKKFLREYGGIYGEERAENVIEAVEGLENLRVRDFMKILITFS